MIVTEISAAVSVTPNVLETVALNSGTIALWASALCQRSELYLKRILKTTKR